MTERWTYQLPDGTYGQWAWTTREAAAAAAELVVKDTPVTVIPAPTDSVLVWDCDAYGPGSYPVAQCFVSGMEDVRLCPTKSDCDFQLTGARRQLFDRIHELAKDNDPAGTEMAKGLTHPDQLLGGGLPWKQEDE